MRPPWTACRCGSPRPTARPSRSRIWCCSAPRVPASRCGKWKSTSPSPTALASRWCSSRRRCSTTTAGRAAPSAPSSTSPASGAASEEQRFLAEATRLLNDTLDYQDTLGRLVRLAVPAAGRLLAARRARPSRARWSASAWRIAIRRSKRGWCKALIDDAASPRASAMRADCCRSCAMAARCCGPTSRPRAWRPGACARSRSTSCSRSAWRRCCSCRSWCATPSSAPSPGCATPDGRCSTSATWTWPRRWRDGPRRRSRTPVSTAKRRPPIASRTSSWPRCRTSCARR